MLLPLSIALVAVIAWALGWAIRSGQFDDLDGASYRILLDDDDPPPPDTEVKPPPTPRR